MATSDSDDFESADEELVTRRAPSAKVSTQWKNKNSAIDSESDDDNECMQPKTDCRSSANRSVQTSGQERRSRTSASDVEEAESRATARSKDKDSHDAEEIGNKAAGGQECAKKIQDRSEVAKKASKSNVEVETVGKAGGDADGERSSTKSTAEVVSSTGRTSKTINSENEEKPKSDVGRQRKERPQRQSKPKESKNLGARKLDSKVETPSTPSAADWTTPDEIRKKAMAEGIEPPLIEECWELDDDETSKIIEGMKDVGLGDGDKVEMPEELKSDKKFREIFKPDGWEGLDNEDILAELDNDGTSQAVDEIAKAVVEEPSPSSWGGWGSWGVSSFINSATAGVTSLTSHVTHGLELLDQAVGAPRPEDLAKIDLPDVADEIDEKSSISQDVQPQLSFGFNDLISGVSSITKLVESTGTKVITGGLGTLETIGKKTMEVLQEGDPGLKKKRAYFLNDVDKPILSKILREAKDKAETEEKTIEDKQLIRKVHFESLFDDYQGLVHLEALEMLSKQCNMKIQQRLVDLDVDDLNSVQETLEEVKELCDLGDDDDEDDDDDDFQERLKSACKDLGVAITYEKFQDIWKDTRTYLSEVSSPESTVTKRDVFQRAISTLARLTAFSVERFHKTAELLLIKERRSTVNEADALVQLTRILSVQIGIAANMFSNWINEREKNLDKIDEKVDITTIFIEAANASSYIQDAFRLLIPILQVGAI